MQNIPIPTVHLFPILEEKLIELLRSLSPEEWNKPTIAKLWNVKDVAAHLLDGNIRALAMLRDNYFPEPPAMIAGYGDLVNYLNNLNADWVRAMKRMSPQTMVSLLETTGKQYNQQIALQDPFAQAIFAVSWAGETSSVNWFHIAREYTERWHHQQQIRDAVNKPGIMTKELYYPVLDTFMRALPFTYKNVEATENAVVQISITGTAGGDWFLVKKHHWDLSKATQLPVTASVVIDAEIAWKLFTKSWRRKDVQHQVSIHGDHDLGENVLDMIAVMA